jgi:hypothetical protein
MRSTPGITRQLHCWHPAWTWLHGQRTGRLRRWSCPTNGLHLPSNGIQKTASMVRIGSCSKPLLML